MNPLLLLAANKGITQLQRATAAAVEPARVGGDMHAVQAHRTKPVEAPQRVCALLCQGDLHIPLPVD